MYRGSVVIKGFCRDYRIWGCTYFGSSCLEPNVLHSLFDELPEGPLVFQSRF